MNNTTVVESRSERSVTKALRCNLRAVLLLRAGQRFMLIAPILVPFFAHYGQDMQQIFLLESFYALIILLMEIPSGYLADRYGRVAVLRAGGLFWSLSWLSLIWVQGFSGLMAFNVLAGLGTSLLSGADLALLYDTERELQLDKPDRANRAVRNLFVIGMTAEGLASLSATGLLFYGDITLVIAAQTACGLLVLGAAMLLRETPRVNSGYKSLVDEWGDLGRVLTSLWWHSVLMRRLLATLCLWPVVIVLAIWLMQRVWVELDLTLLHFGWIWCLLQLVGALVAGCACSGAAAGVTPCDLCHWLGRTRRSVVTGCRNTVLGHGWRCAALCRSRAVQRVVYGCPEPAYRQRLSGDHQLTAGFWFSPRLYCGCVAVGRCLRRLRVECVCTCAGHSGVAGNLNLAGATGPGC